MKQIIVFGHSVTAGHWDTKGGWVQRLKTFLDERALEEQDESLVFEVYNLGIGGDTSEDLLERMENELAARIDRDRESTVLVQIGGNDSVYLNDEDKVEVKKEQFRENIRKMIEDGIVMADELVFVGDFPKDPELEKIPYAPKRRLDTERIQEYEEIKKQLCREKGIQYIDLFPPMDGRKNNDFLEEGVHPNNEGHQLIFEKVREELEERELI